MFEKTLTDIVKGIRASKRDTALYISQCIAEIKTEINSSDMYVKANALQKLTFLQMMGYSMSWASFASIEVMSSPRFAHKRIGYLSASQGFTQDTDVVLLTTNLLKKELRGAIGGSMNGVYEAGLAINCVSNIVTEELAQDLLPELTNLTQHPQPYVRKKAILCLFKLFVKYPQGLRLTFAQVQQCLSDSNPAVVSCAVNVITELSDKNPKNYLHLAPAFFDLLTTSSNNWMLIKVVKLLGSLVPEEPRLARKLLEPLADIVRNTPAKSLLYESVHAITLCLPYCRKADGSMPASVPEIVALCAQTLKEFVEEQDQNLKYLGLVGFGSLMQSHPKVLSAPNYRPIILTCLSDEDVTIRTRALGLLPSMASRKNVMELVTQLLQHVEYASGDYKLELVRVIVEMCSGEKYALLPDFSWYLDTLFQLGHMRGLDTHADLLRSQVNDVALRVLPVRGYAVKRSIEILLEGEQINVSSQDDWDGDNGRGKHIMPDILPALAWIVGEYSDLIPEVLSMDEEAVYIYNTDSEGPYHSIVQVLSDPSNQVKLPPSTQKVYVQGSMKVFAAATANSQVADIELEACCKTLISHLPVYMQSTDPEVQERAFTAHALLESLDFNAEIYVDSPPALAIMEEDDEDEDNDVTAEGNLLEMPGATLVASSKSMLNVSSGIRSSSNTSGSINRTLAINCREASSILNYLLKPSPMKPTGAKAQRKKHQAPIDVAIDMESLLDVSIFSVLTNEERSNWSGNRLSMEAVSFTQQRPRRTSDKPPSISIDAVSSQDMAAPDSTLSADCKGSGSNYEANIGQQNTSARSTALDRPQTASDPFYLNSGPATILESNDGVSALPSRFGAIQLGDGDGESDAGEDVVRKKRKKKKDKKEKVEYHEADVMSAFGTQNLSQNVAVYGSDDDEDDNLLPLQGARLATRKGGASKEFQGLAKVDLTMPLREDEVMPERKHRVVPEQPAEVAEALPQFPQTHKSRKKKKDSKKKKKKKKEGLPGNGGGVGDLLDLAGFSSLSESAQVSQQPTSFPAPQISTFMPTLNPTPVMQTNDNLISNAFDDLLNLSDSAPVPQLLGAPKALAAPPATDTFNGIMAQAAKPQPWVRGTIKTSHSSGSPIVDWSKVQILFRLGKTGYGDNAISLTVRVDNFMERSGLDGLGLDMKSFGNVHIGTIAPKSSAESKPFGPFSLPAPDSQLEMKGSLRTGDCEVPIKLCVPVTAHISPVHGLKLEDVGKQLASPQWTSFSTKLQLTGVAVGGVNAKALLSSFLSMAEVEPETSGPSNGTLAGKSASGAQILILLKVKKEKVKIDLKSTDPQLGEAIVADLKRLLL